MKLSASKALEIRLHAGPILAVGLPGECRVYPLDRDAIVVGAELGCAVHLRLPGMAARHLMIQRHPTGFEIFDLSGAEGATLNDRRLEAGELRHGDRIGIGLARMVMIDPSADTMPAGFQLLGLPLPLLREEATREAEAAAAREPDFNDLLIEKLRRAPWLLASAALQALIAFLVLQFLDDQPKGRPGPQLAVDMVEAARSDDWNDIDEDLDELRPELEEPSEEEPVEIDESETPTSADLEGVFDDDAGDPGMTAVGLRPSAMGDAGLGRNLGGPGGLGGAASGRTARKIADLRQSGLDLVVLLDTTSSMGSAIDAAQQQIGTFIATLDGLGIRFRLGVVAYRDQGEDEDYLTLDEELSPSIYRSVRFIDRLSASGGGDAPEAVYEALKKAMGMRFSPRAEKVLILVGDAPPHAETMGRIGDLLGRFRDRGGQLHAIFVDTLRNSAARSTFRNLAERGGGRYVELRRAQDLVREVLAVTLAAGDDEAVSASADAESLLAELDAGRSTDAIRRRLKAHDPDFVEKMLRADSLHPRLSLELNRHNGTWYLPAYLAVLRDQRVPSRNRWLAAVMLRRAVFRSGVLVTLDQRIKRSLGRLDEIDPDDGLTRQKRILDEVAQTLFDLGLLEVDTER
ncbi:MAG: VWA domain-containing protein [Planctomycetes bacterium]|nr:VWA domain-containing protein [Planctomycetota bacterium]